MPQGRQITQAGIERKQAYEAEIASKLDSIRPEDKPESEDIENCITEAKELLQQREELNSEVQECREYATLAMGRGNGSRRQVEWILRNLPRKERGKRNGSVVTEDTTEAELEAMEDSELEDTEVA